MKFKYMIHNSIKKVSQDEFDAKYLDHSKYLSFQPYLDHSDEKLRLEYDNYYLSNIKFPQAAKLEKAILRHCIIEGVNLKNANLRNVDLTGAYLRKTDLRGADLRGADLRGADLRGADLRDADLRDADLRDADLRDADLLNAYIHRSDLGNISLTSTQISGLNISNLKADINWYSRLSNTRIEDPSTDKSLANELLNMQSQLERSKYEKEAREKLVYQKTQELESLRQSLEEARVGNNKNASEKAQLERQVEQLETNLINAQEEIKALSSKILEEQKKTNEKIREIEERGKDIEKALDDAFDALSTTNNDIGPDIKRLNGLFWGFIILAVVFFSILGLIWYTAFKDLHGQEVEIKKIWIYLSPSFILVGFIWICILQINRSQRQLVTLKKYSRKYKVVKIALEGYYKVENKLNKTPEKAKETFNQMIQLALKENIDTDLEEKKIKDNCSTDQLPAKETLDQLIEYIEKLK